MGHNETSPMRRFMRHTAIVPKGLLRHQVLLLLKEKPMSGSEIMEEVEKRTGGMWKPSPGSVYPLLSWLQENNYTKEIPGEKGDYVKRYMLTTKGEEFLEKQTKLREDVSKKLGFFAPPFLWFSSQPKLLGAIHKPIRRFIMSMMDLRMLGNELTGQDLEEISELLNSTALRIEEITERLKEQNR